MATKLIYTCDGSCGEEAEGVTGDRESDQWGVSGIPTGWLEVALVRWGEPVEVGNGATRREAIFDKAVFHSAACLVTAIEGRELDVELPGEG